MEKENIIQFTKKMGKLKTTKRTGWVRSKIKNPESVADHSFKSAVLGMLISDIEGLDTEKIMRMLLLHDIQEGITGDISALEKKDMDKDGLKNLDRKAVQEIFHDLPESISKKYTDIWEEMEELETEEAKFCKDIERLEMMIQLMEYEETEKDADKKMLSAFWERWDMNAPKRHQSIIEIYEKVLEKRSKK